MPGRNHSRQFKLECVRQVATGQKDTDSLILLRMAVTALAGNTHLWHSSNSQRNRRGARSGGRTK